jgi:hypothetical protein
MAVNPFGSVFVQLEKAFYNPGDQVSGFIYINLLENFPNEVLTLHLTGTESTKLVEVRSRTVQDGKDTRTVRDVYEHYENNCVYNHKFPVYQWPMQRFFTAG